MATSLIPLIAAPQSFTISLGGVTYGMRLYYADTTGGGWFLDLSDANGALLVAGVPLVPGTYLLAQYANLGIAGDLIVLINGDPATPITFANLGTVARLYYVSDT